MPISMSAASIDSFNRSLKNLGAILDKGAAHAEQKKFDVAVLLNSRLAPDMLPLTRQVQIACDAAKSCGARLAGVEVPKHEDTETTLAELNARITKVLDFLATLDRGAIDASAEREITVPVRDRTHKFSGLNYLLGWALPNLYFHVTMTYAILRHNGVDLGKMDYLGPAA